jgi:hypothetical protein
VQLFTVHVRTILLSNIGPRFLFRGEGCDTPSVTVVAIVLQ